MIKVDLIELQEIEDDKFLCAVIAAQYKGKWVFVREKGKSTWELPGGGHEPGEKISETAARELYEETGARDFNMYPVCISSVNINGKVSLGKLFYAEIFRLGDLPDSEIEEVRLFDTIPEDLTYPFHRMLLGKAIESCITRKVG